MRNSKGFGGWGSGVVLLAGNKKQRKTGALTQALLVE